MASNQHSVQVADSGWARAGTAAGLLAIAGGVLTFAGIFPDFDSDGLASRDLISTLVLDVVIAAAMVVAGALLLARGEKRVLGGCALVVLTILFTNSYLDDLSQYWGHNGPEGRAGVYLNEIGYLLALIGAVVAAVTLVAPALARSKLAVQSRTTVALLAGILGFVTAIGFGLNPFRASGNAYASPFDTGPRVLWSALLVAVLLTVLPALVAVVRDRVVALGLILGLFMFLVAEGSYRVLTAYDSLNGHDTGDSTIEGTWLFVAAGGAVVALLVLQLRALVRQGATGEPADVPPAAPSGLAEARRSAALRFAGLLALGAALLAAGAIFPRYFDGTGEVIRDFHALLAYQATLAVGLFIAAILLLTKRWSVVGACGLAAITALMVVEHFTSLAPELGRYAGPATGGWLNDVSSQLALVGAGVAVLATVLSAPPPDVASRSPRLVSTAVLLGFATAVGFGMHFVAAGPLANVVKPLSATPRVMATDLFVAVALCVLPGIAIAARRRAVTVGVLFGLSVFVTGVGLFRLLLFYAGQGPYTKVTEGGWTFVAAGLAMLFVVGSQLVESRREPA